MHSLLFNDTLINEIEYFVIFVDAFSCNSLLNSSQLRIDTEHKNIIAVVSRGMTCLHIGDLIKNAYPFNNFRCGLLFWMTMIKPANGQQSISRSGYMTSNLDLEICSLWDYLQVSNTIEIPFQS